MPNVLRFLFNEAKNTQVVTESKKARTIQMMIVTMVENKHTSLFKHRPVVTRSCSLSDCVLTVSGAFHASFLRELPKTQEKVRIVQPRVEDESVCATGVNETVHRSFNSAFLESISTLPLRRSSVYAVIDIVCDVVSVSSAMHRPLHDTCSRL